MRQDEEDVSQPVNMCTVPASCMCMRRFRRFNALPSRRRAPKTRMRLSAVSVRVGRARRDQFKRNWFAELRALQPDLLRSGTGRLRTSRTQRSHPATSVVNSSKLANTRAETLAAVFPLVVDPLITRPRLRRPPFSLIFTAPLPAGPGFVLPLYHDVGLLAS
jgi:hypothetical protein